jgi:aryl sulfotransferase
VHGVPRGPSPGYGEPVTDWTRYRSSDEDSGRWERFRFRDGDIVISTRSKSGTTWVQMICALLVFGTPDLPAPLTRLSPWVDHAVEPVADVVARLEAQQHRRFVKTHTPLDGIPLDDRATYVVVARHPLDMAVSLYHQGDNIDRERVAELTGVPYVPRTPRPPVHDWLVRWTQEQTTPAEQLDSLAGVLHHVGDGWARAHDPGGAGNVVLVHYADLLGDLSGQMRRLAQRLGVDVAEEAWPALVEAARFASMRSRSAELMPDTLGVLKDGGAFFRSGRSGGGRELLSPGELAAYERRVASALPPDVVAWLHR